MPIAPLQLSLTVGPVNVVVPVQSPVVLLIVTGPEQVILGAVMSAIGAATPEPEALTHPLTVCVSVYVPALLTLIDDVVAVVLHNRVPDAVVDKVDVPLQLLTTLTVGVDGVVLIVKLKV